jgi:hypothetical protein
MRFQYNVNPMGISRRYVKKIPSDGHTWTGTNLNEFILKQLIEGTMLIINYSRNE